MNKKSTLRYYKKKKKPKFEKYITNSTYSREIFQLRTGQAMLKGRTAKFKNNKDKDNKCVSCEEEVETEEHLILECKAYENERRKVPQGILKIPDWKNLSEEEKMKSMLFIHDKNKKEEEKTQVLEELGKWLRRRNRKETIISSSTSISRNTSRKIGPEDLY